MNYLIKKYSDTSEFRCFDKYLVKKKLNRFFWKFRNVKNVFVENFKENNPS